MTKHITLNIEPKPLPRARVSIRNNFANSYYPKKVQETFNRYQQSLSEHQVDITLYNALEVELEFYIAIPKSWSKKKKLEYEGRLHNGVYDLDNLIKMILDRSEGILFNNDKIIYSIKAIKYYSNNPRIEYKLHYKAL